MTAVTLGPKIFSRTCIQGFSENRKRSGCVDRQQVRSIEPRGGSRIFLRRGCTTKEWSY